MQYKVQTDYETLYSITLKYYGNTEMLEQVVINNPHIKVTYLVAGDIVYLPAKTNKVKQREKVY